MSEVSATPVTLKCKICGGDIVNDYLVGSCVCAHCGNKWSLEDLVPDYSQYSGIVSNINKANETLGSNPTIVSLEQARLLFKNAADESSGMVGVIASDLTRISNEGLQRVDQLKTYLKGKSFFDKQNYQGALKEFKKIPRFKDTEELSAKCKENIEKAKKKRIPLAVIVGLILPAVICIILKEVAGFPIAAVIPIFLAASAGVGFLVYRGGVPAVIIEVLSVLCAVPLLIFLILAYGFHIDVVPSAIIAVGLPVALVILFGILAERKS